MWSVYIALVVFFLSLFWWTQKSKTNPKKNSICRPVSNIERYSVVRNEIDAYYGYSVGVRLHSKKVIPKELEICLKKSTYCLFREFTFLSLTLDDPHACPPEFIPLVPELTEETIPFEIVERVDGNTIKNVLVKEHNRKWDARKILWRIILVVPYNLKNEEEGFDFELVFSPHHVIADGMSGLAILGRLLEYSCNRPVDPKPIPLSPPLEGVVDVSPDTWFMVKVFVVNILLPNFIASRLKKNIYAGPQKSPTERKGCPTNGVFLFLDHILLNKLTNRCREEKTTVHGSLVAALLISIDPLVPKPFVIRVGSAVNIRYLANPPLNNNVIGVYVAGVDTDYHRPIKSKFWTLAREAKHHINKEIKTAVQMDGMLDYLGKDKWENFWKERKEKGPNGRSNTISISNLGVWNLEKKYGDWQVVEGYFSQCSNAVGPWIQLSVVTVNSRMCVSVTFSPVLTTQLQIHQFTDQFQKTLQNSIL